jgi:uncharacterized membrane-anchored protein
MSDRVRTVVLFATAIAVLALANLQILDKERIVRDGTVVLLRLAPIDPRSLMQGDYMALRYAMTRDVARAAEASGISDGVAVFRLGALGEAEFVAIYADQPLAEDEILLRFRRRADSVRIASDAFFFEEGQLETYRRAAFGELRVAADGAAVLTGLRDAEGRRLGASLNRP